MIIFGKPRKNALNEIEFALNYVMSKFAAGLTAIPKKSFQEKKLLQTFVKVK